MEHRGARCPLDGVAPDPPSAPRDRPRRSGGAAGARAASAALLLVAGCDASLDYTAPPRRDAGADARDAPAADVPATPDARASADATAPLVDAPLVDTPLVDAPLVDAPPACVPTRTSCNMALECGAIPNGCPGGVFGCAPCGGGETWCATLASPRWRARVTGCVSSVSSANPTYFDPAMACRTGTTYVVPSHAMDFVRAVAACANGSGAIARVDPNAPSNEIRVRGTDDDVADNYSVILYGSGCSSARYTSSCTPSFF